MIRLHLLYCCFVLVLISGTSFAQIGVVAVPYSVSSKLASITEYENLSSFNVSTLMSDDSTNQISRVKTKRFAKMIPTLLHPYNSGTWSDATDGRVWRLGIRSSGAYSLYTVFGKFKLSKGVKLFVYNPAMTAFAGAYTSANNNRFNVFSIAPLAGETQIIELDIPSGTTDFGELTLTSVGHDYTNEFGDQKLKSTSGVSQSCNIDISCPAGGNWQTEKNAVCKLIANGSLCTGSLINNTEESKIAYLLTAYHCVQDSEIASTAIFYFGYERTTCNGTTALSPLSIAGASLMATTDNLLDFSLLKLSQYPPQLFNPYFLGWDASTNTPQSGVCIHHPNGDVKKISFDNEPLSSGDFGDGFDSYSHWLVSQWDIGATEGGSSGSPIFNSAHHLFGTLTGGDATCSNPVDDYFLKFYRSWNDYPESSRQLKHWLDPVNSGLMVLDGINPYSSTNTTQTDTFTNIKNDNLTLITNKFRWGWISGHNSDSFSQFAEKFDATSSLQLYGMYLSVGKVYANSFSTITLDIWDGTDKPTTLKYSQEVYLSTISNKARNYFYFDSAVNVSGTFFVGYTIHYQTPADTFAVYTAVNRGVDGSSSMYIYSDTWHNINEVTNPVVNTSLSLGIISSQGDDPSQKVKRTLKIVPNPCQEYTIIQGANDVSSFSLECFNIMGQKVSISYTTVDTGIRLNLSNFASGVYTVVMHKSNGNWTGRLVVYK